MTRTQSGIARGIMLLFAIIVMVTGAYAQDFNVTHLIIPEKILPSQNEVELECRYHGNFTILSWFKGPNEFFRYRPGDAPSIRSFPVLGVGKVQLVYCGPIVCRIKLGALTDEATGLYRCDIERDVVPYKFASKSGHIKVLGHEHRKPLIEGLATEFAEGDEMLAYCRAESNTEVRWYINEREVNELRGESTFRYKSSRLMFLGMPPAVTVQCAEIIDGRLIGSKKASATWSSPLRKYYEDMAEKQKNKASILKSNPLMPIITFKFLFCWYLIA